MANRTQIILLFISLGLYASAGILFILFLYSAPRWAVYIGFALLLLQWSKDILKSVNKK